MSEFAETVDAEVESLEDVQARHRREVRELDTKARFLLKAAKKGRAAEAETEVHIYNAYYVCEEQCVVLTTWLYMCMVAY